MKNNKAILFANTPKIILKNKSKLAMFGWVGLIKYLFAGLNIFTDNITSQILIDLKTITLIFNKEALYKNGYITNALISYLYAKILKLDININIDIICELHDESIYIILKINIKSSQKDTVLGLFRIKGITSTLLALEKQIEIQANANKQNTTYNRFLTVKELI